MKRFAIAAAALALSAVSAFAADMVTKAAPVPALGYPTANGFYFGVGASSSAGSSTVANTGVFAAGAGVDLVGGYQWKGGLDFVALEVDATYTNLGASALCSPNAGISCSVDNQWEFEPLVKFGFPIQTVLAALPNLSSVFPALPQLPASFVPTTMHPYIYAGVPIRNVESSVGLSTGQDWIVQGEIGAGVLNQIQNGLVADTRAGCSFGGGGLTITGGSGVHTSEMNTTCTARLDLLY